MTDLAQTTRSAPHASGSLAARIVTFVRTASLRRRTRLDLARLDSRLLRDIGLDPMSAQHESSRHFWQD